MNEKPDSEPILVHVASCMSDSGDACALMSLINDSSAGNVILVDNPNDAELVILTGIREKGVFANFRGNSLWRRFPDKCFAYYEGDNPPSLLHGVCASIPRWKSWFGRFCSFGYPLHARWAPNPAPSGLLGFEQPKRYLFSFTGRKSHAVRRRLFEHAWPNDVLVRSSEGCYDRFSASAKIRTAEEVYWQTMAMSKFALCPRGAGVSSIRLFEAMSIGVAPIIIAMVGCHLSDLVGRRSLFKCAREKLAASRRLLVNTRMSGRNEDSERSWRTTSIFERMYFGLPSLRPFV